MTMFAEKKTLPLDAIKLPARAPIIRLLIRQVHKEGARWYISRILEPRDWWLRDDARVRQVRTAREA